MHGNAYKTKNYTQIENKQRNFVRLDNISDFVSS